MPIGTCHICTKGHRPKMVYGPVDVKNGEYLYVCDPHRNDPKAKVECSDVNEAKKEKKAKKLTLQAWFKLQLSIAPKKCECGCGERLTIPGSLPDSTIVAHILDKREDRFPSVATHPLNRMFLTWQHHTDWDNATWAEKEHLPMAALAKARVKEIYPHLTEKEKGKLPAWIIPIEAKEKGLSVSRIKKAS